MNYKESAHNFAKEAERRGYFEGVMSDGMISCAYALLALTEELEKTNRLLSSLLPNREPVEIPVKEPKESEEEIKAKKIELFKKIASYLGTYEIDRDIYTFHDDLTHNTFVETSLDKMLPILAKALVERSRFHGYRLDMWMEDLEYIAMNCKEE